METRDVCNGAAAKIAVAYLPELGTDLVTALAGLDVDDFAHVE